MITLVNSQNDFDPIKFLNLVHLSPQEQTELLPKIYKDMTVFLLKRFVENLNTEQFNRVENLLPDIKTYNDVINLIEAYEPNFQNQKLKYLEDYKKEFSLERLTRL